MSQRTYHRIRQDTFGGPEVLEWTEEPLPEPAAGQLRVRTEAAGVSFADILIREGIHPEAKRPPFTPGWDVVGRVEALGPGVGDFAEGDRVAALPVLGGYSEVIVLPAEECVRVPESVEPAEAACLPMDYMVAYQIYHRSAQVKEGERVLIHGAAGGVGSAALQLGRLAGLQMIGTASAPKHDLLREYGATPIDYRNEDFTARIHEMTGDGVDVVIDGIGGAHLGPSDADRKTAGSD